MIFLSAFYHLSLRANISAQYPIVHNKLHLLQVLIETAASLILFLFYEDMPNYLSIYAGTKCLCYVSLPKGKNNRELCRFTF